MSIVSLRHALRTQDKIAQISRLLAPLGGVEAYFAPGESVAILADGGLPLSAATGVNAHPAWLYALKEIALSQGVKEVNILLHPAPGFDFAQTLQRSGYGDLAGEKTNLINLTRQPQLDRPAPLDLNRSAYPLYKPLLEADALISLSKFKCDKDLLFGSAVIHLTAGTAEEHDPAAPPDGRTLTDVAALLPADLHIVDGLRGSAGYQPQDKDFLAAATDPWALDTVLTAIAGIPAAQVSYLCLGSQYGLGSIHPADIVVVGDGLPGSRS
ncbi:MAG: DUF362 domain-containing protein [Firmicutes bacterium]|nr:DUF362 domain-containing protein [Bacillota bacterium]